MIHLFINSLAASAGGGLTYTRNVLPHLIAHKDVQITAAVTPKLRSEFAECHGIEFVQLDMSSARRFLYEQRLLQEAIRRAGADVLLSTGNFAIRRSPVPQILLSRNSIYTSKDFYRDLLSRGEYRLWFDTHARAVLARKSVQWADNVIAPSHAFAIELERWTRRKVHAIHHGFDHDAFTRDKTPLPSRIRFKLDEAKEAVKLLFVSHYNYYRNFETLVRSLPLLQSRLGGRLVRLLLTCDMSSDANPGPYNSVSCARLIRELGVKEVVVELGEIPYSQLHHLYCRADVYVTPAYTETFAHPLVEAMSSRVPIVASDIPVHREICEDAALYFDRFSPNQLADRVAEVIEHTNTSRRMINNGTSRSAKFSWKSHAQKILDISEDLLRHRRSP